MTAQTGEELRLILEKIPSHDYIHDLDALRELLIKSPDAKRSVAKSKRKITLPKIKTTGTKKVSK